MWVGVAGVDGFERGAHRMTATGQRPTPPVPSQPHFLPPPPGHHHHDYPPRDSPGKSGFVSANEVTASRGKGMEPSALV